MFWQRLSLLLLLALLGACSSAPKEPIPALRMAVHDSHSKALRAIQQEDLASAAEYWQQTLLRYQALDDWQGQGQARLGLAQAQHKLGQLEVAQATLKPLLAQVLFGDAIRAQAHLQLAMISLPDVGVAAMYLAESERLCAKPCALQWAQHNLAAKIAASKLDWPRVAMISGQLLATAPATERAEIAHAHRLQALALLRQQQAGAALPHIQAALELDRVLAKPAWLLEDYRLQLEIATVLRDEALQQESRQRLQSVCQAVRCDPDYPR